MKILLLHYAAQPVIGGVERVVGNHARLLSDHGHQVQIIAGRGAQVDPRVPFVRVPLVDSLHPKILALKSELDRGNVPKGFAEVVSKLEKRLFPILAAADVVIAHNVCSLAKNLPLTSALESFSRRHHSPPLILWHHDIAWLTSRYRDELHPGFPWELLRTHWPGVKHVTISKSRQNQLARLLRLPLEQIQVIPGGVDAVQLLNMEPETHRLAKQLGLLDSSPLLLLPVRLTRRKNIEKALRVLRRLRTKSFPDAKLVITGPPGPHNPANQEYFQFLIQLRSELSLDDAAYFLAEQSKAYLPDFVIADLFRLADALILTSFEEGFGLPLLEAGMTKLPIFCSDLPSLREIGGHDAIYFSLEASPNEIAQMIAQGLEGTPAFRLRSRIIENYSWECIYAQIAEKVLGQTGDRSTHQPPVNENRSAQSSIQRISGLTQILKGQSRFTRRTEDWLRSNTFHFDQFSDLEQLHMLKHQQKLSISLVLPALNVALTLDEIIRTIKNTLVVQVPLIDEIVLIDSGSEDETCSIAADHGVRVVMHQNILPSYGARTGKGEALWKSLYVTQGDILVWVDTDIFNFHPFFIYGLLGPLLMNEDIQFVKGYYRRPLIVGDQILENAGGRVTELTVRPLLNLYYPELSGILQPLAGEAAGRRSLLEQLPYFSGYGVEIGLLLDIFNKIGLNAIAQVDLGRRTHVNKTLRELSMMSFAIIQAFMSRAENRLGRSVYEKLNKSMIVKDYLEESMLLERIVISEQDRPPMIELPEYLLAQTSSGTTFTAAS